MADLRAVEDVAELLRQVGRRFVDRIAHRDFGKRPRKRHALGAVDKARAQGLGIALAGLEDGVGRTVRHHENDRAHDVFVSHFIFFVRLVQLQLRFDVACPASSRLAL